MLREKFTGTSPPKVDYLDENAAAQPEPGISPAAAATSCVLKKARNSVRGQPDPRPEDKNEAQQPEHCITPLHKNQGSEAKTQADGLSEATNSMNVMLSRPTAVDLEGQQQADIAICEIAPSETEKMPDAEIKNAGHCETTSSKKTSEFTEPEEFSLSARTKENDLPNSSDYAINFSNLDRSLRELQWEDDNLKPLLQYMAYDELPEKIDKLCRKLLYQKEMHYFNSNLELCRCNRPKSKPKTSDFLFENNEILIIPTI